MANTLIEVKNMTAEQLKAGDIDLEGTATDEDFIEALTDAKVRDEKLAEQGRTITALTEASESQKARIAQLESAVTEAATGINNMQADLDAAAKQNAAIVAGNAETVAGLTEQLKSQTALAGRYKALATLGTKNVAQIQKLAGDYMAELTTDAAGE